MTWEMIEVTYMVGGILIGIGGSGLMWTWADDA